jgi:retron-type reverse transcriptase
MQLTHLHYVVEVDIKAFFDEVNHSKLIKQIWAMGIRDTKLIYIIKQMLKAPIQMPDGLIVTPTKGTPQGGILSPLLANIVLNELDWWVESQWQENPVTRKYKEKVHDNGSRDNGNAYVGMRKTKLKEMYLVSTQMILEFSAGLRLMPN